jgi:anti-sigma regulatory factor (Ser/Thr protein kinase)
MLAGAGAAARIAGTRGGAEGCCPAVSLTGATASGAHDRFRHEAVLYRGLEGLRATVLPFVRDGLDLGEPVLVAMLEDRVAWLREALGPDADRVDFVDMREVGSNPSRVIPVWKRFVEDAGGGPVRGVGEPVWAGRRRVELEECVLHESLLNVAFDDGPGWQLLCPYDEETLPRAVLDDVFVTHPVVPVAERPLPYLGHDFARSAFAAPLPPAPEGAVELDFRLADLALVRDAVLRGARAAGLGEDAAGDLALAAHEVATNSIQHGGGRGRVTLWSRPEDFVVEVRDAGRIDDPMVGRELVGLVSENGRGVWMANQLCDLVQVRSGARGTVVRLYAWR